MRGITRAAEDAGATGLWACDHLFWHRPVVEPLTALAVAATASVTSTLGTCVLQLPLRNPAAVARQAGSLQVLSEGRFVLGVGIGSHAGEYEASGADYSRRGRLLDDGITALRAAWQTAGREELRYRQDPATPPIPIWIAGTSDAALRRAARFGDGWVPLFVPQAEYGSTRQRLFDLAERAGRDPDSIETSIVVVICTGASSEVARKEGTLWLSELYDLPPKAFERHLVAGSPEDCASGIAAYHEAGAGHVVVMVASDDTLAQFGPVLEALHSGSARSQTPVLTTPSVPTRPDRVGVAP